MSNAGGRCCLVIYSNAISELRLVALAVIPRSSDMGYFAPRALATGRVYCSFVIRFWSLWWKIISFSPFRRTPFIRIRRVVRPGPRATRNQRRVFRE